MQKIDDDASITQLAGAWINLASGGERINEAFLTYTDLIERYSPTSLLLNGLATCNLHLKKYNEAEKNLLQALEKDTANSENALVNLITCFEQQGKPTDVISRQINQLKITAPQHPWLIQFQRVDDEFERVSKSFSFTN